MIFIQRHVLGHYVVTLDEPEFKAIRNLADKYGMPFNDMLVGCINKGIDVIGKQVKVAEKRKQDEPDCDDIC